MNKELRPATIEIARAIASTIAERKGDNIRLLDLRNLTDIADWFIIASAQSRRHLRTLGEDLVDDIKKADIGSFHVEGLNSDSWVIIDLFDVVVHLFIPERREYFGLDDYWADAPCENIVVEPLVGEPDND